MKRIASLIMVCVFASFGCVHADPSSGDSEGNTSEATTGSNNEGDAAPNGQQGTAESPREVLQTCKADSDCAEGLSCLPCVNTESTNCVEYCKAGDEYCHNGVATCPIGAGLECESVTLCQ